MIEDEEKHKVAGVEEDSLSCDTHSGEQVQMYCEKCKVLVCHDCIAGNHKSHAFAKIPNVSDQQKEELQDCIERAQKKLGSYQSVKKVLQDNKSEYMKERNNTVAAVKEKYMQLKCILDKAVEEINIKLEQQDMRDQDKLDKKIIVMDETISSLQEFIKRCQDKMASPPIEVIRFMSKATNDFRQFYECEEPEILHSPVFKADYRDPNIIVGFLGYVDEDDEFDKMSDFEGKGPFPKIEVKIVSSFTTEADVSRICTVDNKTVWLGKLRGLSLKLVDYEGRIVTTVTTSFETYHIDVSLSGDLLATVYRGCKVKKLTQELTFVDLCDTTPFCTYGLYVTESGDIIIGLFDYHGTKKGRIMKISQEGQILKILQYKSNTNLVLFDDLCPVSLVQTRNGNIFAILANHTGSIRNLVCVDWFGNVKFTYKGPGNTTDTEFCPTFLASDQYNNIIVDDHDASTIHLINENGSFIQYLLTEADGFKYISGLHVDKSGCLWVSNGEKKKVYRIKYIA